MLHMTELHEYFHQYNKRLHLEKVRLRTSHVGSQQAFEHIGNKDLNGLAATLFPLSQVR